MIPYFFAGFTMCKFFANARAILRYQMEAVSEFSSPMMKKAYKESEKWDIAPH
jgi:hypothetical protein